MSGEKAEGLWSSGAGGAPPRMHAGTIPTLNFSRNKPRRGGRSASSYSSSSCSTWARRRGRWRRHLVHARLHDGESPPTPSVAARRAHIKTAPGRGDWQTACAILCSTSDNQAPAPKVNGQTTKLAPPDATTPTSLDLAPATTNLKRPLSISDLSPAPLHGAQLRVAYQGIPGEALLSMLVSLSRRGPPLHPISFQPRSPPNPAADDTLIRWPSGHGPGAGELHQAGADGQGHAACPGSEARASRTRRLVRASYGRDGRGELRQGANLYC
ncbi:hypothetical protein QYE76_036166 [Lolium multiflorum]|uniref:Uncharacterized protein n=1 Tax=Lolium multiflorum TaxID=4521 RepID=A0AAD8R4F2_LOLMU|nr:hypothetical protein QYE76_036166 [Lolium multiflorum]